MEAKDISARMAAHRLLLILVMVSLERASLGRGFFQEQWAACEAAAFEGLQDEERIALVREEIERVLNAL